MPSRKVSLKQSLVNRPSCGGNIKSGLTSRSTNFMAGVKKNHHLKGEPFVNKPENYKCSEIKEKKEQNQIETKTETFTEDDTNGLENINELWEANKDNIPHYSFDFRWNMYSVDKYTQTVNIIVRDNDIQEIKYTNKNQLSEEEYKQKWFLTMDELFEKVMSYTEYHTLEVRIEKKYGYITDFFVDLHENIADEEVGFSVSNFKILSESEVNNGFYIYSSSNDANLNSFTRVKHIYSKNMEVTKMTKDFPPSSIWLQYNKCETQYKKTEKILDNTVYYIFGGNYYVASENKLLRYSPDGIVTEDYIVCRKTVFSHIENYPFLTVQSPL